MQYNTIEFKRTIYNNSIIGNYSHIYSKMYHTNLKKKVKQKYVFTLFSKKRLQIMSKLHLHQIFLYL